MNELQHGDTIQCSDLDEMELTLQELRDQGYSAWVMDMERYIIIVV